MYFLKNFFPHWLSPYVAKAGLKLKILLLCLLGGGITGMYSHACHTS
jgi:hypothetical protein